MSAPFDAAAWVERFEQVGGGFATMSGGRFAFLTAHMDGCDLERALSQLVGWPERLEAVRSAASRPARGAQP